MPNKTPVLNNSVSSDSLQSTSQGSQSQATRPMSQSAANANANTSTISSKSQEQTSAPPALQQHNSSNSTSTIASTPAAPTATAATSSTGIPSKRPSISKSFSQGHAASVAATRSNIRPTPLPPNHNLINLQHLSGSASQQRQYVLLRSDKKEKKDKKDKKDGVNKGNVQSPTLSPQQSPSNSIPNTPNVAAVTGLGAVSTTTGLSSISGTLSAGASPALIPGKPKPFLKKMPSSRYIFSVDDDEGEIENDLNREYLEGYNDAIRHRFKKNLSVSQSGDYFPPTDATSTSNSRNITTHELEHQISQNLSLADRDLNLLRVRSGEHEGIDYEDDQDNGSTVREVVPDDNGEEDYRDDESVSSLESFTLRERQDAINETHPFGIRIWKPAIYKKNRSVEIEAENDIHSSPHTARRVTGSVWFFNLLWSLTFGLFLLGLCYVLGAVTSIIAVFANPRKNESLKYAKLFFKLGHYFFFPFGKIVLLKTEKHYISEDANVGSSLNEFRRWRAQESSKLFFSAPQNRQNNSETTPLTSDSQSESANYTNGDAGNNNPTTGSSNNNVANPDDDDDEDESGYDDEVNITKHRFFGRGQWNIGRVKSSFSFVV
ncbi:unnamed protein product [Ambrosiozyma monospora]|uniref:Unnamed protein product n=1 Tax=Ambrosiozyma monospora TaxID=43982 RepID=A0ACB5SS73_AMBMO|nr:unnamed protein product [Ambrosiozyma monospora]